jgi:hypothetical protein
VNFIDPQAQSVYELLVTEAIDRFQPMAETQTCKPKAKKQT